MDGREPKKIFTECPKETNRVCVCVLDDGSIIESTYIICPTLGIGYFKEVINTGRFVVSWNYKD